MGMVKGILALALLSVLTAGDAFATSGTNLGVTSVNGPLGRAVQVGSAVGVEQPAASSPAQGAPTTVNGHATGLGSTTPQPLGPSAAEPAAQAPAPLAHHPICPAGQHLGIMCTAP